MESVHSRPDPEDPKESLENKYKLLKYIHDSVIGLNTKIRTPYGMKPLTYCDYTASGRALSFIEDYIRNQILPIYANTHTLNSRTAKQTIYSREEARDIIKRCVNGNEKDAVIFIGNGSTAAVNHLVRSIDTSYKNKTSDIVDNYHFYDNFWQVNRWKTFDCTLWNMPFANQGFYESHEKSKIHQHNYEKFKKHKLETMHTEPPVVFVSIMEHNSNLLPWRESGAIVEFVDIREDTGELDYEHLKSLILKYSSYNGLKIGTFTAASNITGTLNDVDYISYLLHKNGALSFVDYASAAPYIKINVNGSTTRFNNTPTEDTHLCYKDAIFISPHKFVGGPDTPGLLICKKQLLCNALNKISLKRN
jgi:selenocysteine lyase/cysteine desulfurase